MKHSHRQGKQIISTGCCKPGYGAGAVASLVHPAFEGIPIHSR